MAACTPLEILTIQVETYIILPPCLNLILKCSADNILATSHILLPGQILTKLIIKTTNIQLW
jgi:hypothetical protein